MSIKPQKPSNSLGQLNHYLQQLQLSGMALTSKKITTKLDTNKHFSCIYVHKDQVYMGTRNSKLYVYRVQGNNQNNINIKNNNNNHNQQQQNIKNNECYLILQKILIPHCQIVSLVVANQKYFITVPQADQDSMISIWDSKSKMLLTAIKGHKGQVSQVIFLTNQKYMATSSWDCNVRVFQLDSGENFDQPVKVYTGHYPILVLKQFNEEILVFGGDDCYLVFWNWKKNQVIKKQFGHAGSVTYIEILGNNIFTAGGDNKFKLWQVSLKNNQTEAIQQQSQLRQSQAMINHSGISYIIKKTQQQKQQYDSIIFGVLIDNNILLIDRQGEMFIFSSNKHLIHLKNYFQYNENITGIGAVGYDLFVTTTKGAVKHFNVKEAKGEKDEGRWSSQQHAEFNVVQVKSNDGVCKK